MVKLPIENFKNRPSDVIYRISKISVFFVAFVGIAATVLTFYLFYQNQQNVFRSKLKVDVDQRTSAIEKEMVHVTEVMYALNSFYRASRRVEREEFRLFTESILRQHPEIEMLEWAPRVPHAWRDSYELSKEGTGISFKELNASGEYIAAEKRSEYYPVFFVEPEEKNRSLLGFDILSDPKQEKLLFESGIGTKPRAGEWWSVEEADGKKDFSFEVVIPFFKTQPRVNGSLSQKELSGYLISNVRVGKLIESAFRDFSKKGMDIYLSDSAWGTAGQKLYYFGSKKITALQGMQLKKNSRFRTLLNIDMGGQRWYVLLQPTKIYFQSALLWVPWGVLAAGLLLTFLFNIYLWNLFRSKKALQSLNLKLFEEIHERERAERLVRTSEEHIRQIINLVPHMIYARDFQGHFLLVNKQTADAYGKKVSELIGLRYQDIHLSSEEIGKVANDDQYVIKKKKAITLLEEKFTDVAGDERILQTTKIPYHWDDDVGTVVLSVSIDITERKLLEEVRLSEERYRGVIEQSIDALFLVKETGIFSDVNQMACESLGYQKDDLLKMSIFDIDQSLDKSSFAECWSRVKENKNEITEAFYLKKNDIKYPVEVSITRVVISHEMYLMFSARDITQLKRMNKELRKANTFLDLIFENIPNMVFIKDAKDLRFIRFNKAGADLIGVQRKDMIGKNDYDLFPEEQARFFIEKDREVLNGSKLVDIPAEPISTKSKETRYLHTKKIPIADEKGKPIYLLGISEDVTDQKMAFSKLEQSNLAMENALEGIARVDEEANYVSVNHAYAAMLGYESNELVGVNWSKNIHPQDRGKMKELFRLAKETDKIEGELRALHEDGSLFYEQVVIVKNKDPFDPLCRYYCFFKDITEKKYRTAIESKSDLISMVSHELRTPLHSIREGISVMLDGLVGEISEQQKEILLTNMMSLDRLTRLVNSFLDFQRLEAGVVEFNFKNHDIKELIEKSVMEIESLAASKGLTLEVLISDDLPLVRCDADRTILVLLNLLGNAIKFTLQGGVAIYADIISNSVRVLVKDTGVGIKEEEIPRLFQKFGQLESGKLVAPAGTGLGLAISRKVIEAQQGTLDVESIYNKGSIFSFTIPMAVSSVQMTVRKALS